jgi:uncharacterized damage-inducible protein DinB
MTTQTFAPLDIAGYWERMGPQLDELIDLIPGDKMNWSPKPELFNFRGVLLHIAISRHGWLGGTVRDGEEAPDILRLGQTKEGMKEQLRLSWERMRRFLSDPAKLDGTYENDWDGEKVPLSGHWIAYHLLEHDVHHRADIFHYLALLGIEHPDVTTP